VLTSRYLPLSSSLSSRRRFERAGGKITETRRNPPRELPSPAVVLGQNRGVTAAVSEHADSRNLVPGIVANRRARAKKALHRVGLDRRRSEPHDRLFRFPQLLGRRQPQTTQPPRPLPRRAK